MVSGATPSIILGQPATVGAKSPIINGYSLIAHQLLRRSRSFKVIEVGINRKPVCDFLSVIDILSRTVSGVIANYCSNIGHFAFFAPPIGRGGLRDNVRCSSLAHWKARLLISVNWTFFARCWGWGAIGENRSKIGDFAQTRSVWPKISGRRRCPPPIIFARIVRPMNALQLSLTVFKHINFVADFLQAMCDFTRKSAFLHFWAPFGDLDATYDDHLTLIGKPVVDYSVNWTFFR